MTGVVQGPAWAQQLSNTLGYTVTPGEPYFCCGLHHIRTCVFPNAQIPSSAFHGAFHQLDAICSSGKCRRGLFSPHSQPDTV